MGALSSQGDGFSTGGKTGHPLTGLMSEPGLVTWSEVWGQAASCGCRAWGLSTTTSAGALRGHSPHVEGGHQPHHILPIFGQLELGNLRWVKVRGVIFLWGGRQCQRSCFQVQERPEAEGRGSGELRLGP